LKTCEGFLTAFRSPEQTTPRFDDIRHLALWPF
jgi:hypothetical protein